MELLKLVALWLMLPASISLGALAYLVVGSLIHERKRDHD